uniref:Uncharacterized protein n=1 Tax=Lactuca sativa TaxID=4236 RepID=A0A9R1W7G8_LACSA|nr:hypothetical protein LSAT_V11C300103520 [Lactuca sativa]
MRQNNFCQLHKLLKNVQRNDTKNDLVSAPIVLKLNLVTYWDPGSAERACEDPNPVMDEEEVTIISNLLVVLELLLKDFESTLLG